MPWNKLACKSSIVKRDISNAIIRTYIAHSGVTDGDGVWEDWLMIIDYWLLTSSCSPVVKGSNQCLMKKTFNRGVRHPGANDSLLGRMTRCSERTTHSSERMIHSVGWVARAVERMPRSLRLVIRSLQQMIRSTERMARSLERTIRGATKTAFLAWKARN